MRPALLLLFTVATAAAQTVDVRDLPPLPEESLDEKTITETAATLAAEDVVVGAAKREQSLGTVASAVTVISADRIRRFGYRTVAEAVAAAAGMFVVDDHMTERLGIRGLQLLGDFNTHILVLIDGATINEPWNQFVGIGLDLPITLDDIERIEVVRGPVSSVYGTNAFFGIVNIVTRGADRSPRAWGRTQASTFGQIGGSAGFALGDLNRQLRGSVFYQHRAGETLDYSGGRTSADGMEALNASLVGHYDGGFVQVRAYRRERQLPFSPYGVALDDSRNHNIDQMIMAEGGYTHDIGDLTLTARAYANRYQFQDFLVYQPADPNFRDIGDSTWVGGEARARYGVIPKKLELTLGGEVSANWVESHSFDENDDNGGVRVPTNFRNVGVYGEVEATPVPWFSISGGTRLDYSSTFSSRVSPRAALLFHQRDELGFKLLGAVGFRNPSPLEAFFADGMTQKANPDLRPETILSGEAVLWAKPLPGLSVRASGFYWRGNDLLELVTANDGLLQFQNIAETTSTGVEVEASYVNAAGVYAFASGAFSYVTRDGDEAKAQNAPRLVASAGVSSPRLFDLVHVSSEILFVGSRHTRDPMVDAPAWAGWNVAITIPDFHGFDLTLGVRNLIGTRQQVVAQPDYDRTEPVYVLPGEGRELYARLGARY